MTDLWDPVTRGKKCVSCHIGNPDPEEEKVVTHAMYAAGHPPLPGIEVATFSDAQPRHWQYLREKKAEVQRTLDVNPDQAQARTDGARRRQWSRGPGRDDETLRRPG